MNDLNRYREHIDMINKELLRLVNQRTSLVKKIIEIKDDTGTDYYDPVREEKMIHDILSFNEGPLPNELMKEIFCGIFKSTLRYLGMNMEKRLLISSSNDTHFKETGQMFNIGKDFRMIIAGPCAIENIDYLESIAQVLVQNSIKFLRGGAYKPRTSPYDYQGLREDGLKMLNEVSKRHKLLSVTEVVDTRDVELVSKYADVLQIGARNMQNFELLKEVGQLRKPVILKRGTSASIEEFMLAAEYIALKGNREIILCERGIRTFETKTRNTLDISCIPLIKKETKLPIIVDLSHSLGRKDIVLPIAKAVLAAGADGIMAEVHPYPELALSDSKQQLNPDEFVNLIKCIGLKNIKGEVIE